MRIFHDSAEHPMNEVLADFIGYPVGVHLKNGWLLRGPLEVDPDPYTDGYKIGPHCFEKKEVTQLIDLAPGES